MSGVLNQADGYGQKAMCVVIYQADSYESGSQPSGLLRAVGKVANKA